MPTFLSARLARAPARWQFPLLMLPLILWIAADALAVDLGFSRQSMQLGIDLDGSQWPLWASLPLLSLAAIGLRGGLTGGVGGGPRGRLTAAIEGIRKVLLWISAPILVLLLLRLLSLWGPMGVVFPWLGLTWSPHCNVALALVPFLGSRERSRAIQRRTAAALFVAFLLLFGAYTLYICQMVMIHGDEAQYLRVTQSLINDGDIDLSNNLDGDSTEFHVINVGVDRAPGSPEGKLYSKHPVGMSVLLTPAYQLGLRLWDNPRLGAALHVAAITAAIVALLYLWLCHLGFAHSLALWITLACATTTPVLLFSTQIYPELPAVLISLVVLLRLNTDVLRSRDQIPGPPGASSAGELGALTLLAGTLPFLHPRYAPLAFLLGLGLLHQARSTSRAQSRTKLAVVLVVGAACGISLILHNLSFSGDWLGNFRPGNAWKEDALAPATWWMSLPGHWIHASKGLALNAPWFVIAIVPGIAALAWNRDRRLWLAAALYLTTAVVNGIHPDWTFGFCLPSRFLVTALPALALCAAAGLNIVRRTPWLGVLLCGALAVSWDIVGAAAHIPELAYEGKHLPRAAIAGFYPFGLHGFQHTAASVPVADVLLWCAALAALILWARPQDPAQNRPGWFRFLPGMTLTIALLAPALWGLDAGSSARLRQNLSPYLKVLKDGQIEGTTNLHSTLRRLREGTAREDGSFAASEEATASTLAAYYMPIQIPGVYRVVTKDVVADGAQVAYISHQRTLPALQSWTERLRFPIHVGADSTFRFDYYHDRLQLGYLHFLYSGQGTLQLGLTTQDFHAQRLPLRLEESARFNFREASGPVAGRDHLARGRYLVRFQLAGGALESIVQRQPKPVKMAVFVSDGMDLPLDQLQPWFSSPRRMHEVIHGAGQLQPQRERITAPWWTSVPIVGDSFYEMSFLVRKPGLVWFLFQYEGSSEIELEEIVVYRQHLEPR